MLDFPLFIDVVIECIPVIKLQRHEVHVRAYIEFCAFIIILLFIFLHVQSILTVIAVTLGVTKRARAW